jgi:hypothetical protein
MKNGRLRAWLAVLDLRFRAIDPTRIGEKRANEAKNGRNKLTLRITFWVTAASEPQFDENEAKDAQDESTLWIIGLGGFRMGHSTVGCV